MNSIEKIEHLVIAWATERGIYEKSNAEKQQLKLTEEVGELSKAILENNYEDIVDGIGDCLVVLTNITHTLGIDLKTCYLAAYTEISGRRGEMKNGTFVKDEK